MSSAESRDNSAAVPHAGSPGDGPSALPPVQHEESERGGAFHIDRDGSRVAEMTYRRSGPEEIVIDHTEVDEELRGEGVARGLLDALVAWARKNGTRVRATCPYARAEFERDPSIGDVRA